MNELPPNAKAWLARARRVETPPDGAQERVRQRLATIVGGSSVKLDRALDSQPNASGVPGATASTATLTVTTTKLLIISGAIVAFGGALAAKHFASERAAAHDARPATASTRVTMPHEIAPRSAAPDQDASGLTTQSAPTSPARRERARSASAEASHAAKALGKGDNLREEMALLAAASDALDDGDSARAYALLATHRKRFPQGELREESRGLTLLANCIANKPGTAARVSEYLRSVPNGVLSARIESACSSAKSSR
jgi:hypothetical protein